MTGESQKFKPRRDINVRNHGTSAARPLQRNYLDPQNLNSADWFEERLQAGRFSLPNIKGFMQISPETNLWARVYAASPVSPTMAVAYQFCLYSILRLKKQLRYRCAARCHKVVPLR